MRYNLIVGRRTLPWETITWDEFLRDTFLHSEVPVYKFIIPLLRHWDKCCGLSYFQYRAGLRRIARRSWRAVPETGIKQISWYSKFLKRSRDTIVTFVDDDDWIAPDIFVRLRLVKGEISKVFLWNIASVRCIRPAYHIIEIAKHSYDKFKSRSGLQFAVCGPAGSDTHFPDKLGKTTRKDIYVVLKDVSQSCVVIIPESLSVYVQSLGSTSQLKCLVSPSGSFKNVNTITAADPQQSIRNFEAAVSNWTEIDTSCAPSSMAWSVEYTERLNELNRRTFG